MGRRMRIALGNFSNCQDKVRLLLLPFMRIARGCSICRNRVKYRRANGGKSFHLSPMRTVKGGKFFHDGASPLSKQGKSFHHCHLCRGIKEGKFFHHAPLGDAEMRDATVDLSREGQMNGYIG